MSSRRVPESAPVLPAAAGCRDREDVGISFAGWVEDEELFLETGSRKPASQMLGYDGPAISMMARLIGPGKMWVPIEYVGKGRRVKTGYYLRDANSLVRMLPESTNMYAPVKFMMAKPLTMQEAYKATLLLENGFQIEGHRRLAKDRKTGKVTGEALSYEFRDPNGDIVHRGWSSALERLQQILNEEERKNEDNDTGQDQDDSEYSGFHVDDSSEGQWSAPQSPVPLSRQRTSDWEHMDRQNYQINAPAQREEASRREVRMTKKMNDKQYGRAQGWLMKDPPGNYEPADDHEFEGTKSMGEGQFMQVHGFRRDASPQHSKASKDEVRRETNRTLNRLSMLSESPQPSQERSIGGSTPRDFSVPRPPWMPSPTPDRSGSWCRTPSRSPGTPRMLSKTPSPSPGTRLALSSTPHRLRSPSAPATPFLESPLPSPNTSEPSGGGRVSPAPSSFGSDKGENPKSTSDTYAATLLTQIAEEPQSGPLTQEELASLSEELRAEYEMIDADLRADEEGLN